MLLDLVKLDPNGGQYGVRLNCPHIWKEAGRMAHMYALMGCRQLAEKRWLIPALDSLSHRMPRHPPPLPLGCRAIPGPPDAIAAATRVLVRASHVLACAPLYCFRGLCSEHALHAALPPEHARLGRHWLQVGRPGGAGRRRGGLQRVDTGWEEPDPGGRIGPEQTRRRSLRWGGAKVRGA